METHLLLWTADEQWLLHVTEFSPVDVFIVLGVSDLSTVILCKSVQGILLPVDVVHSVGFVVVTMDQER